MAKTKKSSKRNKKEIPISHPPEEVEIEKEKPNDFGGIPSRDLKKNLGCG